jgi:hypothetical protein
MSPKAHTCPYCGGVFPAATLDLLIGRQAISDALGISTQTLTKYEDHGLPIFRISGKPHTTVSALQSWANGRAYLEAAPPSIVPRKVSDED